MEGEGNYHAPYFSVTPEVYLFSGATGELLYTFEQPPFDPSLIEFATDFGWAVVGLPDTNDDGLAELVVGSPGLQRVHVFLSPFDRFQTIEGEGEGTSGEGEGDAQPDGENPPDGEGDGEGTPDGDGEQDDEGDGAPVGNGELEGEGAIIGPTCHGSPGALPSSANGAEFLVLFGAIMFLLRIRGGIEFVRQR